MATEIGSGVVVDLFRLSDGRTVMPCSLETQSKYIGRCRGEIVCGDTLKTVNIDGEDLPETPHRRHRVLSTRDAVDIAPDVIRSGACRIRLFVD